MSVEIAWKQNILVTDFQLLKSLLVVLGFGSQTFLCGFSRQNICSVLLLATIRYLHKLFFHLYLCLLNTIAITPKSEDKYVVKVFKSTELKMFLEPVWVGFKNIFRQSCIFQKFTSFKIGTLVKFA